MRLGRTGNNFGCEQSLNFDRADCPFDFESIIVYDRGSQPLGIGVPPNGKVSVNLTFCVTPWDACVPPGVPIPHDENCWSMTS